MKDNTEVDFNYEDEGTKKSRKEPEIYLNIGPKGKDITLPYGEGLDTMPSLKISGSAEWQKVCLQRNRYKEAMLKFIRANCKPGEEIVLGNVTVRARIVNPKVTEEDIEEEEFDFA